MEILISDSCLVRYVDLGGDILPLSTNGKVELEAINCARSCMQAEGCIAFTLKGDGKCWLRSSVVAKVEEDCFLGFGGCSVSAIVSKCWLDPLRKDNFDGKITANAGV